MLVRVCRVWRAIMGDIERRRRHAKEIWIGRVVSIKTIVIVLGFAADDGTNPARTQHGARHGMGDPVAANSRLHLVGSRAGSCFPSGNGSAAARRPPPPRFHPPPPPGAAGGMILF